MRLSQLICSSAHTVRFRLLLLVGVGLAPLWIALLLVAYVAMTSPNEAAVAGWVLVPAIPASGVTLLIAVVGIVIYSGTRGEPKRKLVFAGSFVLSACLLLIVTGLLFVSAGQDNVRLAQSERNRVLHFVESHPDVRKAAGEKIKVLLSSETRSKSGPLAARYDVAVTGTETFEGAGTFYAVVGADRATPASFTLLCTTPLSPGQRDSSKGPCEQ